MSLASTTNRTSYPGAGSVGPFAVPFRFLANTDLRVIKRVAGGVDTLLSLATDYTVTGAQDASGTVTLTTALVDGETLVIRRAPDLTQPTSIENQSAYFPKTIEDEFDRLVMQLQKVGDAADRSIGVPESYDPNGVSLRVRPETGKALVWQSGTQLGNSALDASATALPGRSRTTATLSAYLLNNAVFNVKDYGAIGGYASNPLSNFFATLAAARVVYPHAVALSDEIDWAAIQLAINQAQALFSAGVTSAASVYVPSGVYLVNRPLTVANAHGIRLYGDGIKQTAIVANGAMAAVLTLGDLVAQLSDMAIEGLLIDGGALRPGGGVPLANYGIYGARVDNARFMDVGCSGCAVAGCSIGYGYTNVYIRCRWQNNAGDGFQSNTDFAASNNASTFIGCLALGNTGFGYRLRSGAGISFYGGDVEQNGYGGIFVTRQINGLSVHGVYFEGNTGTGYVLSGVTVRGHIVLNGAVSEVLMSGAFPSAGVSITGCFVSSHGLVNETFVYAIAAAGLRLSSNQNSPSAGGAIPLLTAYMNPTLASVSHVESSQNNGFTADEFVLVALPVASETTLRRWKSSLVSQMNFAETDFMRWFNVAGGGGGTFRRSSDVFRGQPVWEIQDGVGQSNLYGFSIDMANYPLLQGKTVYFGAWVDQSDVTGGATLYANGNSSSGGAVANAARRWVEVATVLPGAGVVNFGFYNQVAAVGKAIRISEPVLAIVGASAEEMPTATHKRIWWGVAASILVGTWAVGDRVQNSAPAVGSPKGWMCTVAGTPGTWVSEGNL